MVDQETIRRVAREGIKVVGVMGQIGAGKDYFASLLTEYATSYGVRCQRRAMGDSLKEEVAIFLAENCRDHYQFRDACTPGERYALALECLHGESRPEKEQFRLLMQWWGTEYRRDNVNGEYWAIEFVQWLHRYAAICQRGPKLVTVPDIRFRNEVDCIYELGGVIVWITSDDAKQDSHKAENALADGYKHDFHIHRTDCATFKKQVKAVVDQLYPQIELRRKGPCYHR
jgi:hypothetical protein